jgi:menaquinone-9 beta-reductase
MQTFDIIIIGAGPAGCSAALTLQKSNFKIALFEKDTFPREKICGDGICDRSINTLKKINESYFEEFLKIEPKQCIKKTSLIYKNHRFDLDFKSFGYTCRRIDFDSFLFSLVERDCTNISIFQNTPIAKISKAENGYTITTKNNEEYFAKMILVANGAKSEIEKTLTQIPFIKSNQGVAIRAYYKNVQGMQLDAIELHYKKEYFPGYLWVFPVTESIANVGFGYHLKDEHKFSESIQDIFHNWIKNDASLQKRFENAEPISALQGGLIPYNSNSFNVCGDNFMICGDAASLIDPISGGGIGSAMLSGHFAALQAEECCLKNDFSKSTTIEYEKALKKRIQKEIKRRYYIQKKLSKHLYILDVLSVIGKNSGLLTRIKNWYVK